MCVPQTAGYPAKSMPAIAVHGTHVIAYRRCSLLSDVVICPPCSIVTILSRIVACHRTMGSIVADVQPVVR